MMWCFLFDFRRFSLWYGLVIFAAARGCVMGQPTPASVAAFNSCIDGVEARLSLQHRSATGFLAPEASFQLRRGELIVEQLTPSGGFELPGALLHHWRGTAFIAGGKAADFERLLRDLMRIRKIFRRKCCRQGCALMMGIVFRHGCEYASGTSSRLSWIQPSTSPLDN
jgi:hypothetical protein